jgi:hypothetical protein
MHQSITAPPADTSLKIVEVPLKQSSTEPLEKTHTTKQEMPVQPKVSKSSEPTTKEFQTESSLSGKAVDDDVVARTSMPKEADVAAGLTVVKEVEAPAVPVVKPEIAKEEVPHGLSTEKKVEGQKVPAVLLKMPEKSKNSTNEKVSKGKTVRFSVLEVRDYPICVGVNPAVSKGVPLTIVWTHDGEFTASIDDYESSRGTPRSMLELRIPSRLRAEITKGLGFSTADLMAGTKAANIIRFQRRRTIETLQTAPMQELLEKFRRAILNATIMRGRKRREREYLYDYKTVIGESKRQSITDTYIEDNSNSLLIKDKS